MEKKKFDANSFIGLLLLGAIMLWFMYTNQEEVTPTENTTETVVDTTKNTPTLTNNNVVAKYYANALRMNATLNREYVEYLQKKYL